MTNAEEERIVSLEDDIIAQIKSRMTGLFGHMSKGQQKTDEDSYVWHCGRKKQNRAAQRRMDQHHGIDGNECA